VSEPALLEIALWTGRILEREIDRRTTVDEVYFWKEAEMMLMTGAGVD
jgi:hypothetical protein